MAQILNIYKQLKNKLMQTTNIFLKETKKLSIFLLTVFFSVIAFAQDKASDLSVDVNTTKSTTTTEWYTNPIYWVIGAVVLIIIVALISRGGGRRD